MIYPEKTTEEWLKEHKGLKMANGKCNNCGETMVSTIPVITRDTVALISPDCSCGKNTNGCMNFIFRKREDRL